ncbi:MAG: radical SAM protein [Owenweeksia sp.]|nr:radical SAM protein [Owenweeksia sp.]
MITSVAHWVDTLYFGGGTPSVLTQEELGRIIRAVEENFNLAPEAEITLEANPDDLHSEKLNELAASPINRLSIGLQSFDEEDLRWIRKPQPQCGTGRGLRTRGTARRALKMLLLILFTEFPGAIFQHWQRQLKRAMDLKVPHILAYALTVENETVLENWIRKGHGSTP